MPPRKRAASAPKLPHTDACAAPARVETFPVVDADGAARTVVRCIDCGAQTTRPHAEGVTSAAPTGNARPARRVDGS